MLIYLGNCRMPILFFIQNLLQKSILAVFLNQTIQSLSLSIVINKWVPADNIHYFLMSVKHRSVESRFYHFWVIDKVL